MPKIVRSYDKAHRCCVRCRGLYTVVFLGATDDTAITDGEACFHRSPPFLVVSARIIIDGGIVGGGDHLARCGGASGGVTKLLNSTINESQREGREGILEGV